MATYKATAPQALINKIKANSTVVNRAAAQALNKTATFAVSKSIAEITKAVNLSPEYVKKHFKVGNRASPSNLAVVIYANERATLLTRYRYNQSSKGIKVAINKGSGFTELRGAFKISGLRGSQATGIAMRNKVALEFFERAAGNGERTNGKSSKLSRLAAKAKARPNGIYVLHSRSINQLFTSVRDDVGPLATDFLLEDFLEQFNRLKLK